MKRQMQCNSLELSAMNLIYNAEANSPIQNVLQKQTCPPLCFITFFVLYHYIQVHTAVGFTLPCFTP